MTTSISPTIVGNILTPLRWVIGWTYFSAFWRRVILENKLDPEAAGYIGEKFNHFLPNALGIKPIIEYLVLNPDMLEINMIAFTIIEAIVGLFLILGWFTRLMSVGVFMLALGILLGSGWLGTTCLDEWQIGVLGVAGGFVLYFAGSGTWSLDFYFRKKHALFNKSTMPIIQKNKIILFGGISILALTLFTNQYFHGGVYGTLHNKSVKPKLEIYSAEYKNNEIIFDVMRVEGADVYGSFVIEINVLDAKKNVIQKYNANEFNNKNLVKIENLHVAKIKPSTYSLIFPLGARAKITLPINNKTKPASIIIKDVNGTQWNKMLNL